MWNVYKAQARNIMLRCRKHNLSWSLWRYTWTNAVKIHNEANEDIPAAEPEHDDEDEDEVMTFRRSRALTGSAGAVGTLGMLISGSEHSLVPFFTSSICASNSIWNKQTVQTSFTKKHAEHHHILIKITSGDVLCKETPCCVFGWLLHLYISHY